MTWPIRAGMPPPGHLDRSLPTKPVSIPRTANAPKRTSSISSFLRPPRPLLPTSTPARVHLRPLSLPSLRSPKSTFNAYVRRIGTAVSVTPPLAGGSIDTKKPALRRLLCAFVLSPHSDTGDEQLDRIFAEAHRQHCVDAGKASAPASIHNFVRLDPVEPRVAGHPAIDRHRLYVEPQGIDTFPCNRADP
jgi:hypothetical protein